jgi:lactoylglutathione lyase
VLGYQEFSVAPGRAEDSQETFFYKVNDHQYIEISAGLKDQNEDRLIHIGFETSDAPRLRDYLASRGVTVPAKVTEDMCGNLSFTVKDPDGHTVEFVQYLPHSIQARNAGNMMPNTSLSDHILHVGIHVVDSPKADAFYKDILGFRLLWIGGSQSNPRSWISYMVPNGREWVEYMMGTNPNPKQLGSMHHVALEVMDIQKPYNLALTRGYTPVRPLVGLDGRWLDNYYDPDGSRTEFMIRKPVEKPCCTDLHDPFIWK